MISNDNKQDKEETITVISSNNKWYTVGETLRLIRRDFMYKRYVTINGSGFVAYVDFSDAVVNK